MFRQRVGRYRKKNRREVPYGLAALFSGILADLGVLPALRSAFFMYFAASCRHHSLSVNGQSISCPGGKDMTWKEEKKSPDLPSGS